MNVCRRSARDSVRSTQSFGFLGYRELKVQIDQWIQERGQAAEYTEGF